MRPFAAQDRVAGVDQDRAGGRFEPEAACRVFEAVEVSPPRERPTVVDAQRLEHAVTHQEPVVEGRNARIVGRGELPVDPHEAHEGTSAPAPATGEEARRLELGLGPLGRRGRVGDDAGADAELGAVVEHRERTDRNGEITFAAFGVDPTERAAVHAAADRFELFDGLQHAWLRGAGHRRRRKRRREERAQADLGAHGAADGADEMVQARVRLERTE